MVPTELLCRAGSAEPQLRCPAQQQGLLLLLLHSLLWPHCWLQPLHQLGPGQWDSPATAEGMPRACCPVLLAVTGVCVGAQARQLILQSGLTLSDLDRHPEVSAETPGTPTAPSESISILHPS